MKRSIYLLLILLFVIYITSTGCNRKRITNNLTETTEDSVTSITKPVLNVFLENSGSMDGYVNGDNAELDRKSTRLNSSH